MSLVMGLSVEARKILRGIRRDSMDCETLSDEIEIVGPELNYELVRMRKQGLVEYDEMEPTVTLTEKGKHAAAELQAVSPTAS